MTKIEQTKCDSCGYVQDGDYADGIYECAICNDDYCEECKNDHAMSECFNE